MRTNSFKAALMAVVAVATVAGVMRSETLAHVLTKGGHEQTAQEAVIAALNPGHNQGDVLMEGTLLRVDESDDKQSAEAYIRTSKGICSVHMVRTSAVNGVSQGQWTTRSTDCTVRG